ncbi:MAG: hypothetical protein L0241_26520, partial [Planctomycetia bacterium]|nr:hypothetical protein [Planctomycetia bacterium]
GAFGSAAGAYLFTFGLPLVAQLPHAQLYPRFLVAPAVVFAWEYLRAPRSSVLLGVGACLAGQTYLSVYIGYFLILLLVTGLFVTVLRFGRQLPWGELLRPESQARTRRVLVIAGTVLAVLPLALGHASGGGVPDRGQVWVLAPRPGAWMTPAALTASFPELADLTGLRAIVPGEQQLLTGLVTLAAVAVGLVAIIRPGSFGERWSAVAVSAWASVLLALFVTRWEGIWLYAPITYIPGIGGIRAIGRIILVLLFPCAIVVAGCSDALVAVASRFGRLLGVVAGVVVVALVVADQWLLSPDGERGAEWKLMRYPKEQVLARQVPIAEAIRRHPAPTLIYVFPSVAGNSRHGSLLVQLEAMRAAQDHGIACVNGWSGYLAPNWDYFPGYRDLMIWLTEKHRVSPEQLAGLIVIGEPVPDPDPKYEAEMRAKYPPQPAPVER